MQATNESEDWLRNHSSPLCRHNPWSAEPQTDRSDHSVEGMIGFTGFSEREEQDGELSCDSDERFLALNNTHHEPVLHHASEEWRQETYPTVLGHETPDMLRRSERMSLTSKLASMQAWVVWLIPVASASGPRSNIATSES